jgi:hypothetical protein
MACCLAEATCAVDEIELPNRGDCPNVPGCHEVTACCDTIACAPDPNCNALPACDERDSFVGWCNDGERCYERSLCGTTILCVDDACDPLLEFDRYYVAMDDSCRLLDFACEESTERFDNECGCGCAQDPNCPAYVDCTPDADVPPECTDRSSCPFTPRGP